MPRAHDSQEVGAQNTHDAHDVAQDALQLTPEPRLTWTLRKQSD
jgi:hypothetical protein